MQIRWAISQHINNNKNLEFIIGLLNYNDIYKTKYRLFEGRDMMIAQRTAQQIFGIVCGLSKVNPKDIVRIDRHGVVYIV